MSVLSSIRTESQKRYGYTLLELVIASAAAAALMAGLASSIYIASQSLEVVTDQHRESRIAQEALAAITRDVQSAVAFTELTSTTVTMSVPDRDGDNVPETIRYAWSGTIGDPLTLTYNGTSTNLADNVQTLSFAWLTRLIEGVSTNPVVLFISSQTGDSDGIATPSSTEQDRIDLMSSWGFDTTVMSQQASQSQIDAELNNSNVVYVSGEVNGATVGTKLNSTTLGVVTESFAHAEHLGFYSSLSTSSSSKTSINITNTTHYITTGFSTGNLTVATSAQEMKWTSSSLPADAVTLAESDVILTNPSMLILDAGDTLADSSAAAGRRCQLPWGENSFDATALNTDGQTLMQRAIEWAAGAGDDTATATGVEYQNFAETQQGSSTSISIALPVDTVEGDLLVAAVATDGNRSTSLSAPTGWNTITITPNSTAVTLGVWWKIASASEASTHTFTWSTSEEAYGWIMRFTGHDPTAPIPVNAVSTASSSTPNSPAVTTTVDGSLILRIGGFDDDDVNIGDAGVAGHATITANESGATFSSASGAAAYVLQSTAGDSGTSNFTLTATEETVSVTLGIAPPSSP